MGEAPDPFSSTREWQGACRAVASSTYPGIMAGRSAARREGVSIAHLALDKERIASFCRERHIRRLAFFGSVLREDFGPDSDVDVLVEFEPEARVGFLALARAARELSAILGRRVDLVPQAGLKPLIRDEVLAEAEELYAA